MKAEDVTDAMVDEFEREYRTTDLDGRAMLRACIAAAMSAEGSTTGFKYGLRVDCLKNGCERLHDDHGEVLLIRTHELGNRTTVSGHAATTVRRVLTASAWETYTGD